MLVLQEYSHKWKNKLWPDDGAKWKVWGSPKFLQVLMGTVLCIVLCEPKFNPSNPTSRCRWEVRVSPQWIGITGTWISVQNCNTWLLSYFTLDQSGGLADTAVNRKKENNLKLLNLFRFTFIIFIPRLVYETGLIWTYDKTMYANVFWWGVVVEVTAHILQKPLGRTCPSYIQTGLKSLPIPAGVACSDHWMLRLFPTPSQHQLPCPGHSRASTFQRHGRI